TNTEEGMMKILCVFLLLIAFSLNTGILDADEENALEASLEEEEIMNTQRELDRLKEERIAEKSGSAVEDKAASGESGSDVSGISSRAKKNETILKKKRVNNETE
ncbi:MAG: hypothetical protein U9R44_06510, partial [Candidatus Omnitrophota bacterium]|nr:hypothetical protein [Candidatus Omnitrophota bacterium]